MQQYLQNQSCLPVVPFDTKASARMDSAIHTSSQPSSRQLIAAQEKELSYIARELHDNVCQRLAMLSLKIEKAARACPGKESRLSQQLEEIRRQCSDLAGDVQSLSHELHPSLLDNLGLVMAITGACREISEQSGAAIEFVHDDVPTSLPREMSLSLFRVVQEALHNAMKYSGGKRFYVFLQADRDGITLEIRDRGLGFDATRVDSKSGLGLVSMRERIQLLNGTFRIESKPNMGTRICARVPFACDSNLRSFAAS